MTIIDFQKLFPDINACQRYLADKKWEQGFICPKCGGKKYCKGTAKFSRQCTKCRYTDSITSGTVFHGLKFSLLKAFYIIFFMSTGKKGISSAELSRKLGLRQKTCWLFRHKVITAMREINLTQLSGVTLANDVLICGLHGYDSLKVQKYRVAFAMELSETNIIRVDGRVIKQRNSRFIESFLKDKISENAYLSTSMWKGWTKSTKRFPNSKNDLTPMKNDSGSRFRGFVGFFNAWLKGIHHKVVYLQAYVDEFLYRFNSRKAKTCRFTKMIQLVLQAEAITYKMIRTSHECYQ